MALILCRAVGRGGRPVVEREGATVMSPVEYLEQRVAVLQREQPTTPAGRAALDHTIHELRNCIAGLQLRAINELHIAQIEADRS